jgi:hypothetical protein
MNIQNKTWDQPAADLPWHLLRFSAKGLQFQFLHDVLISEEHQQSLAALAARLDALFYLAWSKL